MADLQMAPDLQQLLKGPPPTKTEEPKSSPPPPPAPTAAPGQNVLADLGKTQEKIRGEMDRLPKPLNLSAEEYKSLFAKPPVQYQNPYQGWGAVASQLAVLGSAFTKRPLINGLNAAAAGLNAMKAADAEAAKEQLDIWKSNRDLALKIMEFEHQAYKDGFDMLKEKGREAEANAHLALTAAQLGDSHARLILETQGAHALQNYRDQEIDIRRQELRMQGEKLGPMADTLHEVVAARKAVQTAQQGSDPTALAAAQDRLRAAHEVAKDINSAEGRAAATGKWEILNDPTKKDEAGNPVQYRYNSATTEATTLTGQPYTPGGAGKLGGSQAQRPTLSEDTLNRMADQYLAGQTNVVTGLGYGNAGAANRSALQNAISEHGKKLAEDIGIPESQIGEFLAIKSAEYAGITAGERTLGIRTAQLGLAAQEAQLLMPAVLKASEDVPRTELTDLNRLILAGDTHTGDPKTVRLGIAINSLVNVYARAINPNGVATVSDKEHARDLLAPYWSKGQIREGLDQLNIELKAAIASPARVRQEFREGAGNRATSAEPPAPAGPALPPGIPAGSKKVGTYKGKDVYEAPDGSKWQP